MERKAVAQDGPACTQYAVVCADEALEGCRSCSEMRIAAVDPDQSRCDMGFRDRRIPNVHERGAEFPSQNEGIPRFQSVSSIPMMISDIAAGHISMRHGLQRAQFLHGLCLCERHECHDRRFQLHPIGQGRRDGYGWV